MPQEEIKYVSLEPAAFIGDVDFQLMNSEERGVYFSVILYLYANGGKLKLPNTETTLLEDRTTKIANLANCSKRGPEWSKIWQTIAPKFQIKDDIITHKRVTKELERAKKNRQQKSRAGKMGMKQRYSSNSVSNGDITKECNVKRSNVKRSNKLPEKKKNYKKEKERFLDFVFLTKEEHQKLLDELGEKNLNSYLEDLNNYIGSKGKKYKSHYHTILAWRRKDERKGISREKQGDAKGQKEKSSASGKNASRSLRGQAPEGEVVEA